MEANQEEADEILRLAASDPARYEPDLAASLRDLSLGSKEFRREAVEIYRHLAVSNPTRYEPDLADSLWIFAGRMRTNSGILPGRMSAKVDRKGSVEFYREAVEIYRRLAVANPVRYEPVLANRLSNLSDFTGDQEESLELLRESVEIYRRLTISNPLHHVRNLVMILNSLSIVLSRLGDLEGALGTIREAVELIRPYDQALPESQYAISLKDLERNMRRIESEFWRPLPDEL